MNDLGQLSTLAVYGAMAAYAIAMIAFGIDVSALRDGGPSGRPRKAARIAMTTTTAGAALHLVGVVLRGLAAGRVPWANMYEFTIVFTLVAVVTFLFIQRWRDLRYLGVFVITPMLLALGLAVAVFYLEADGVRPALDSYWLVVHVSVATLAIGVFAVAAALSVVQLIKERGEVTAALAQQEREPAVALSGGTLSGGTLSGGRTGEDAQGRASVPAARTGAVVPAARAGATVSDGQAAADDTLVGGGGLAPEQVSTAATPGGAGTVERAGASGAGVSRGFWGRLADALPGSVELERFAYRLNAVGFLLWTFTLIAGSIWAEHAWGRPWAWDPKEVWTFVIWVVYAAYLHARATRGWDGRRAAYFCLAGFALVLGNYFIVNLFVDSVHGYAF